MLDEKLQSELTARNRDFLKGYRENDPYMEQFESDQERKLPQPPLVKAAMREESARTYLPREITSAVEKCDLTEVLRDRRSSRVYTEKPLTLEQLSYLLWATQGVQSIRGDNYATIRPVPCGGARHEFETYLLVQSVHGLQAGAYHYLPMEHALEFLHPVENLQDEINESLCGQSWAKKASVVFYWSIVPYRAEWRYGIYAHSPALIDVGHVGQNLYVACSALGLGACGIAAFSHEECCRLFGLDGEEEFVIYTAPVGTIRDSDRKPKPMFLDKCQK